MRRLLRSITIAFICGILVIPSVDAQSRRGSGDSNRTERTENRSNRGKRPSASNHSRGRDSRGRNRNNHNTNKPSDNRDRNRGGHRGHQNINQRAERPRQVAPPRRQHRPRVAPYHRPTPPPSFRPHRGCPVLHGILGLTFGTAINLSLDYLYNNGYVVDGYADNVVYLRNVNHLSLIWPDAELYYGPAGLLGSRFAYSTNHYDRTRYNRLYSTFVTRYGAPVSYRAVNNGFAATWFGYDNGYITLEFSPGYSSGGQLRYYTTLTIGN